MSTEADRKFTLAEVSKLREAYASVVERRANLHDRALIPLEEQWLRDWLKHDYDSGKSPYRKVDLTKKRA